MFLPFCLSRIFFHRYIIFFIPFIPFYPTDEQTQRKSRTNYQIHSFTYTQTTIQKHKHTDVNLKFYYKCVWYIIMLYNCNHRKLYYLYYFPHIFFFVNFYIFPFQFFSIFLSSNYLIIFSPLDYHLYILLIVFSF